MPQLCTPQNYRGLPESRHAMLLISLMQAASMTVGISLTSSNSPAMAQFIGQWRPTIKFAFDMLLLQVNLGKPSHGYHLHTIDIPITIVYDEQLVIAMVIDHFQWLIMMN